MVRNIKKGLGILLGVILGLALLGGLFAFGLFIYGTAVGISFVEAWNVFVVACKGIDTTANMALCGVIL